MNGEGEESPKPDPTGDPTADPTADPNMDDAKPPAVDTASSHRNNNNHHATTGNYRNLNELRARARTHVHEAICCLPWDRNHAYFEAMNKAPTLVETESDPLQFLRRCQYSLDAVSERLCLYWKERLSLFGPLRAFLPLTLCCTRTEHLDKQGKQETEPSASVQTSALCQDDVRCLEMGFPTLLQKQEQGTSKDFTTRAPVVAYCDASEWIASPFASHHFLRSVFYLMRLLIQEEQAQDYGIVVLLTITTCPQSSSTRLGTSSSTSVSSHAQLSQMIQRVLDLVVQAMPIQCTWHLMLEQQQQLSEHDGGGGGRTMVERNSQQQQELIASCVGRLTTAQQEIHLHRLTCLEEEGRDVLERLLGLPPECIPTRLGGTWKVAQWSQWCHHRAVVEQEVQQVAHKQEVEVAPSRQGASEISTKHSSEVHNTSALSSSYSSVDLKQPPLPQLPPPLPHLLSPFAHTATAPTSSKDQIECGPAPQELGGKPREQPQPNKTRKFSQPDHDPSISYTALGLHQHSMTKHNLDTSNDPATAPLSESLVSASKKLKTDRPEPVATTAASAARVPSTLIRQGKCPMMTVQAESSVGTMMVAHSVQENGNDQEKNWNSNVNINAETSNLTRTMLESLLTQAQQQDQSGNPTTRTSAYSNDTRQTEACNHMVDRIHCHHDVARSASGAASATTTSVAPSGSALSFGGGLGDNNTRENPLHNISLIQLVERVLSHSKEEQEQLIHLLLSSSSPMDPSVRNQTTRETSYP